MGDKAGAVQAFKEYLRLAPNIPAQQETIERAKKYLQELGG
jgi:hypothetical protein